MIPLKKEPDELRGQFWGAKELCVFCKTQTLHWHENTNNPVCVDCSKKHKVAELKDYGKRIRALKRKQSNRWIDGKFSAISDIECTG